MPLISCQAKSPIQMEPNMESTQTQMFSTSRRLADTLNSCGWFPKKTESVLTCSMTWSLLFTKYFDFLGSLADPFES